MIGAIVGDIIGSVYDMIDYKKLKQDLLNKAGPSLIMPAIIEIESASNEKLVKLAKQYGLDIEKYSEKYE